MKELISIIVPVYNVELYLRECLSSIQNQTYENLEIIIVDDGSTDKSGDICDEFAEKDSRFRVIHQGNAGLANARNVGLREAKGKYIGFVDSDDYIDCKFFEEMYLAAKRSNAYITMCGYRLFGNADREYAAKAGELERNEAVEMLVKDNAIHSHLWDKLFLKTLFDGIDFPDGKQYEDYAVMHLLFLRTNKLKVIDRILYYYRSREGSIVDITRGKKSGDYAEAMEKRCNDLKNTPFYGEARTTQIKVLRQFMIEMILGKDNKTDYYKKTHGKLVKILFEENRLLHKKEVLKSIIFLIFPGLYTRRSK